jgi:hypothetical protein
MKRFIPILIIVAFAFGAETASAAYTVPLRGSIPVRSSACAWHLMTSPDKNRSPNGNNTLTGAVATSSTNAWASGYYTNSKGAHSLLQHWDGSEWTLAPAPLPAGNRDQLSGMSATSSSDVWTVGMYYDPAASQYKTLIDHFDGTVWSVIPSPNVGTGNNALTAVSAISRDDAWAVGEFTDVSTKQTQTLAEHWNGSVWSFIPSPNAGTANNVMMGVAAFGPFDVYTVSTWAVARRKEMDLRAQGAHYDGAWTFHRTPVMGSGSSPFNAIAAVTRDDIWGIGNWFDGSYFQSLAEHWNGSAWSIVPSPDYGGPEGSGDNTVMLGAAAVNANDVWAVGAYFNFQNFQTYTMRWNGSVWTAAASPNWGTGSNALFAAATIPGTNDIWAVGYRYISTVNPALRTLILRLRC